MDYSQKQVINLDKNFSFNDFLEGAKKAFTLIVMAYKKGNLEEIKSLISKEVYENFQNALNSSNNKGSKFNVSSVKASILYIEVIKKLVKIKVQFLSNQESLIKDKINKHNNIKDIWTFEKNMDGSSPIWTLVEVTAE